MRVSLPERFIACYKIPEAGKPGSPVLLVENFWPLKEPKRKLVRKNFVRRGIEIVEPGYVGQLVLNKIEMENGESYASDLF